MKVIFIFAIWQFMVYGAEGCLGCLFGNMLAPARASPNVLVINTGDRDPPPRPAVVHHTVYAPPIIDYRIHGGIAVARPTESPKINIDILGALGKLLNPPARPTESPKIDIVGALGKLLSPPARPTKSPKIDIDILGALGKLLSPPKTNDYGRGKVSGRNPRPRRPMNNYGREEKPGGIIFSGVTNNQSVKVQRPKYDDSSSEERKA